MFNKPIEDQQLGIHLRLETRNLRLLLLCLLASLSLHALDREAFTFTHYDLQAQIDPATHGFAAHGKIVLRNDTDQPQRNPVLQISSSLAWKSIEVNGKPLLEVSHSVLSGIDHTGQLNEAVVTLAQAVPPQGTVELEISYAGAITKDTTRLEQQGMQQDAASASDWDEIAEGFSAVRGVGFVAWYPVALNLVSIGDGSSYSLVLQRWKNREVSSQFKLDACTSANAKGTLIAFGASVETLVRQPTADKKATTALSCASFPATTTGFSTPSFVLGALARRDLAAEGINASIVYPASQAQAAGDYALWMKPAEALTSNWFGKGKRPVLLVALPDLNDAPWESGVAMFAPLQNDSKAARSMLVHQFTHAAFPSPRLWIYEGLAHFAQALEHESQDGRAGALNYMAQQLPTLVEDENENIDIARHLHAARPISIKLTALTSGSDEVLYRSKAMYVWWMLRDMLGDDVLKRALAKYHAAEDTDPAYLQHLLEAEAQTAGQKTDLGSFFNDWVYYDRGLPDFHIPATYSRPIESPNATGGFLVTVTIENAGDAGAEVLLTVITANKENIQKRLLVPGAGKASLRITSQGRPETVSVNDGSVPESDSKNNTASIQVDNAAH